MNLADLTSYVCTKGQMVGTSDIAAAKLFLAKRYELIWNSYLWKDSLVMVDVTVDPTNADNAEGIVLMPEVIERVVAIRSGDRSVKVTGLETFYREDFDKFAQQGTPYEFAILSPVWFKISAVADPYSWQDIPNINNGIYLGPPNPDSRFRAPSASVVFDALVGGEVFKYAPASNDFKATSTIDATVLAENTSNNQVVFVNPATNPQLDFYGDRSTYYGGSLAIATGLNLFQSSGAGSSLTFSGTGQAMIVWRDSTGKRMETKGELPITLTGTEDTGIWEIESVFKTSEGILTVTLTDPLGITQIEATLEASATASPRRQRVRLFYIPKIETVLNILGKRKCGSLTFDQEEPEIRNIDNCLIAFALGDLWARRRQLGKANQYYQEGTALLQELAKLETMQAAHNSRFIPDSGAGDPFFGPGRSGGFWF